MNPNARRLPVSNLAWNAAAQRYITPAGRFKSTDSVFDAINADIEARKVRMLGHGEALKDAAAQFKAGTLDQDAYTIAVKDWRDKMAADVKALHICQGAVASGGFHNLGPQQNGAIGGLLRVQYAYLSNFAVEASINPDVVLSMDKTKRPFDERVQAYGEAGRGTYNRLEHLGNAEAGFLSMENEEDEEAKHCQGPRSCPAMTQLGRVGIGNPRYIVPGFRKCGPRCRCRTKYFKAKAPEAET